MINKMVFWIIKIIIKRDQTAQSIIITLIDFIIKPYLYLYL